MKSKAIILTMLSCAAIASAQVTKSDYLRGDTIWNNNKLIIGGRISPKWNEDNKSFSYKTNTKDGEVKYVVNAETGTKEICTIPDEKKENKPWENPSEFVSPDGNWKAYIKDYNIYLYDNNEKKAYALSYG